MQKDIKMSPWYGQWGFPLYNHSWLTFQHTLSEKDFHKNWVLAAKWHQPYGVPLGICRGNCARLEITHRRVLWTSWTLYGELTAAAGVLFTLCAHQWANHIQQSLSGSQGPNFRTAAPCWSLTLEGFMNMLRTSQGGAEAKIVLITSPCRSAALHTPSSSSVCLSASPKPTQYPISRSSFRRLWVNSELKG